MFSVIQKETCENSLVLKSNGVKHTQTDISKSTQVSPGPGRDSSLSKLTKDAWMAQTPQAHAECTDTSTLRINSPTVEERNLSHQGNALVVPALRDFL